MFTGSETIPANAFAAAGCFEASADAVQSGQLVIPGDGTFDVTVGAVDPAASFLLFSTSSVGNEPPDALVSGVLLDSTTIRFTRSTDGVGLATTIEWSLVTYACGVTVQRGATPGNGLGQLDVPITAVDPASAFVVTSAVGAPTATDFDGDDQFSGELVGPTTVRLASGAVLPASTTFHWQVVAFDDPSDASVQRVTTSLSAGQGTVSVPLSSAVDSSTTMVLASVRSNETGADIGEQMVRAHLSSATTVDIHRMVTTGAVDVDIQVVEFHDGTLVQHGTVDLNVGETTAAVPLDATDPTRTSTISTVQSAGSASFGSTDMVADDVVGEGSVRAALSGPAGLVLTRDAATANSSFGWQVVQWGGPPWWDPDSEVRHRIDVTAGAPGAPSGYSVPVTFDHAALVSSSLSAASGDDVRVLRWDGSWTELDRILASGSGWNQSDTTLVFATTAPLDPSATASYWLYSGDDTPAPPLADPENVWLVYEDFESGTTGDLVDRTGGTAWYQADPWTRQIELVISPSNVSVDQVDLPVLIQLTESDLVTWAQPDGSDIRFLAGATPVEHDLERYDAATGELTAWVNVPLVSSTVPTSLYLLYGATDAPTQADSDATWADHRAVWHMAEDPSAAAPHVADASQGSYDGISAGTMTTGDLTAAKAGQGLDFDGVDDVVELTAVDTSTTALTVSAWFRADTFGTDPRLFTVANDQGDAIVDIGVDDTSATTGQLRGRLRIESSITELIGGAVTSGSWHHIALTYDGATVVLYLDGSPVASQARSGSVDPVGSMVSAIGGFADGANPFDGVIDEVRVLPAATPSARLATEVANGSDPAGFATPGAPTSATHFAVGPWLARKPISLDADLVPTTDSDVPVLVQVIDADLAADAQVSGADIVFTTSDGTTRLDHEIDAWDDTSGALSAWVLVPTLDATTDTVIYMYYDNGTAVDQQDPTAVFADHDAVWHLGATS